MNRSSERLSQLIHAYFDHSIDEAEKKEFWSYVIDPSYEEEIGEFITDSFNGIQEEAPMDLDQTQKEGVLHYIFSQDTEIRPKQRSLWPRIAAAASIIIGVSVAGYFILPRKAAQQTAQIQKIDLLPGGNNAVLISGGKRITLTNSPNDTIAQYQNVLVTQLVGGKIDYQANRINKGNAIAYDTLMTKKGGTYQVKLADGTLVWLNADSKLRYPTVFVGNERKVELISGEAYFEVVHDADRPFKVVTPKQVIEDIGTAFNVNAYPDEAAVKTTLVEGVINIVRGDQNALLSPGQQAIVSYTDANTKISIKNNVNLEEIVAWKNGLFHFDKLDLKEVMKQISRWYDVEVVYEGNIPKITIEGEAYRNMNASQVFEMLNHLKINYRIEARKIIITNKNN